MPLFVRLEVRDIKQSLAWYQEKLGFISLYTLDGPNGPMMAHLRFSKYADLMLVPETKQHHARQHLAKGEGLSIYFTVNKGELDALVSSASDSIVEGPVVRPWNVREIVVHDPDGFRIIIGEGPVNETKTFNDVMEQAKSA
jgi:catechol 2,3-dioxygenase-like lactoylglutathione lyase family enzyme